MTLLPLAMCLLFVAAAQREARGQAAPSGASCPSVPSGLISWWPGDDNANDVTGGNNGALQGGVSFAPGKVGRAFTFAASRGSVVVPNSASLQLTTQFTLAAWINPGVLMTDPAQGGIISKIGGPGGNNGYQFGITRNNSTIFSQFNAPGEPWPANGVAVTLPSPVPVGQWTHVATTYDGVSLAIYVNGVSAGSKSIGAKSIARSASTFRISGDDNNNVYFQGLIDEAQVYNRALSASELQSLVSAATGPCKGLAIHMPAAFPGGIVGQRYSQAIGAIHGTPRYTFSLASGALPPGLTLSTDGVVAGTPTDQGLFGFAVRTRDASGQSGQRAYSMTVGVSGPGMAKALQETGQFAIYGLLFDTDKTDIKPESTATLDEVAKLLKGDPSLKLEVAGHTDNTGTVQHNMALSKGRADAVVQALVKNYGIGRARLQAKGYGDTKPVTPNDTEDGRAKNRRVELRKL